LLDTLPIRLCTTEWAGEGNFAALVDNVGRLEARRARRFLYVRHQPLDTLIPIADKLYILALVRDPRDALISSAHRYVYFNGPSASWVQVLGVQDPGDLGEVLTALLERGHNTWWFDAYLAAREAVDHSLIRYEDMIIAPVDTLGLALERCGIEFDPASLALAANQWDFERLSGGRQPGQEVKGHHYRKGVVGEWRNYLTEAQNRAFFNRFRSYLEPFGYTLGEAC
jgi:hypothetical protein